MSSAVASTSLGRSLVDRYFARSIPTPTRGYRHQISRYGATAPLSLYEETASHIFSAEELRSSHFLGRGTADPPTADVAFHGPPPADLVLGPKTNGLLVFPGLHPWVSSVSMSAATIESGRLDLSCYLAPSS